MITLTVSDEYAKIIQGAHVPIVVVDSKGTQLAQLAPVDPATAAQDATSAEVLAEIESRMANDDGYRRPFRELIDELAKRFPS